MNNIKNILFDLDGTLIEPQEGIINSILFALDKMGIKENKPHELTEFIGPPLFNSFRSRYCLTRDKTHEIVKFYREFYARKGIYQNELYPGIIDLLKFFKAEGYHLYVATSKPTVYANEILVYHNIETLFLEIAGANMDHTRTDKSEIIEYLIKNNNLLAEESVMIGDTKFDILGAKNNNMLSIGVTYGHGKKEELELVNPDFIVGNPEELRTIIH